MSSIADFELDLTSRLCYSSFVAIRHLRKDNYHHRNTKYLICGNCEYRINFIIWFTIGMLNVDDAKHNFHLFEAVNLQLQTITMKFQEISNERW